MWRLWWHQSVIVLRRRHGSLDRSLVALVRPGVLNESSTVSADGCATVCNVFRVVLMCQSGAVVLEASASLRRPWTLTAV